MEPFRLEKSWQTTDDGWMDRGLSIGQAVLTMSAVELKRGVPNEQSLDTQDQSADINGSIST